MMDLWNTINDYDYYDYYYISRMPAELFSGKKKTTEERSLLLPAWSKRERERQRFQK